MPSGVRTVPGLALASDRMLPFPFTGEWFDEEVDENPDPHGRTQDRHGSVQPANAITPVISKISPDNAS